MGLTDFISIPISKLKKADWNYKTDDDIKRQKLTQNIKRNGQIENIIVREIRGGKFEVINGNHRIDSFKDLNIKEIIGYNCGDISLIDAQRISIETNETKFDTDNLKLAETIQNIIAQYGQDDLSLTMPFSDQELTDMKVLYEFNWNKYIGHRVEAETIGKKNEKIFKVTDEEYKLIVNILHKGRKETDNVTEGDNLIKVRMIVRLIVNNQEYDELKLILEQGRIINKSSREIMKEMIRLYNREKTGK